VILPIPKTKIIIAHKTIKTYLPSLPFILRFLNLSDNKGIRVTIRTDSDKDKIINEMGEVMNEVRKAEPE
jgi:histidinol-phosphate/aromatic aminotransferase/cobyric acid decarboxylase-like protein